MKKTDAYFCQYMPVTWLDQPRVEWLCDLCQGKRVLHVGCADYPFDPTPESLHVKLARVASELIGYDTSLSGMAAMSDMAKGLYCHLRSQAEAYTYDAVIAPEVLEHSSSPGQLAEWVLSIPAKMHVFTCPFMPDITAFDRSANQIMERVHPEHYAYYSPSTLRKILENYTSGDIDIVLSTDLKTVAAICT